MIHARGKRTFGRVSVCGTGRRALTLEVLNERGAVLADVAEVHGAAALLQEQKSVEALEQERAGLMDGASALSVRKILQRLSK